MRLSTLLLDNPLRARRPFKLTAAGWVFILYTVGVGAGAINTGNNLLYLIFGVFLGLIMASGALSDVSLWSLEAECFWPRSARAGQSAMIPVRVRNLKKLFPSICVTIELEGELRGTTIHSKAYVPYIPAGGSVTVHVVLPVEERGWFQLRALRFQTRYPFGLLRKQWNAIEAPAFSGWVDRSTGLFVYPSPAASERDERPPASAGANPLASDGRRGDGDNVYGLREYRENDNPRRIHWKASAKRNLLNVDRAWLVRETERDLDSEVVLAWDAGRMAQLRDADREAAIRFGASLNEAFAAEGHRVRLAIQAEGRNSLVVAMDRDGTPEWEFLALWEPGGDGRDGTAPYLLPAPPPARAIDVLEAYRRWMGNPS